jgi:photosystem II stability/assembly factor-like uncharacterized protein
MRHFVWILFLFFLGPPILMGWEQGELRARQPIDRTPRSNFYVSMDGGKTISEIKTEHHIVDIILDHTNKKRLIGVTHKGKLIESYDDGINWKVFKDLAINCDCWEPCHLFMSSKNTIFIYGGYGGKNFVRVAEEKIAKTPFAWVWQMITTPSGDILAWALGLNEQYTNIFISTDDGITWNKYFDNAFDSRFYVSPKGTIFLLCINSGHSKCFRLQNNELRELPFKSVVYLVTSPSDNILLLGAHGQETDCYNFISYDDGLTWKRLFDSGEIEALMQGEAEGTIIIKERDGKLIKYKLETESPTPDDYLFFCKILKFEKLHVFNLTNRILKDIEIKWKEAYKISDIFSPKTEMAKEGIFFLAHRYKLYRTFDNGETWQEPFDTRVPIEKILVHPKNKEKIFFIAIEWPDV